MVVAFISWNPCKLWWWKVMNFPLRIRRIIWLLAFDFRDEHLPRDDATANRKLRRCAHSCGLAASPTHRGIAPCISWYHYFITMVSLINIVVIIIMISIIIMVAIIVVSVRWLASQGRGNPRSGSFYLNGSAVFGERQCGVLTSTTDVGRWQKQKIRTALIIIILYYYSRVGWCAGWGKVDVDVDVVDDTNEMLVIWRNEPVMNVMNSACCMCIGSAWDKKLKRMNK